MLEFTFILPRHVIIEHITISHTFKSIFTYACYKEKCTIGPYFPSLVKCYESKRERYKLVFSAEEIDSKILNNDQ